MAAAVTKKPPARPVEPAPAVEAPGWSWLPATLQVKWSGAAGGWCRVDFAMDSATGAVVQALTAAVEEYVNATLAEHKAAREAFLSSNEHAKEACRLKRLHDDAVARAAAAKSKAAALLAQVDGAVIRGED